MKTLEEYNDNNEYWRVIENILGWKLHSYSNKSSATYVTEKNRVLQIQAHERDAIVALQRGNHNDEQS